MTSVLFFRLGRTWSWPAHSPEEPVSQIEADVPIEPLALHADAMDLLELDLHSYERPLAVSPFGTPEVVPDWQDAHAMMLSLSKSPRLGRWIRTGLATRAWARIVLPENRWFVA